MNPHAEIYPHSMDCIFSSFFFSSPNPQAALAVPERVRLLHKARLINDANHAFNKAKKDAADDAPEVRKEKMVKAAPAHLKGRVEDGVVGLPEVEINQRSRRVEDKVRAAVLERVLGGEMAKELYCDVMDLIMQKWDDERSRN